MESRWPPYPHRLRFGSHLVYPRPVNGPAAENAKAFLLGLKRDAYTAGQNPRSLVDLAVERIEAAVRSGEAPYHELFGPGVALVPAPGAGKSLPRSVSAPRTICLALQAAGLGELVPCLHRAKAVQKSAFAAPKNRPDHVLHFETMAVERRLLEAPSRIVIVDDIVTRGATMLGAAGRLREAFPDADIAGFAVGRSAPFEGSIVSPVYGSICLRYGRLRREP